MKLITAVGTDYKLTVQLVDFFNGDFDYKTEFDFIKNEFAQQKIDELYLILTNSEKIQISFENLKEQLSTDYPNLKIFSIQLSFEDLRTTENDKELKQTLYKQVEKIAGKDLLVSSGGLKNITQRLLEAAYLFGAKGYFSMTSDETLKLLGSSLQEIRNRTKELNIQFTKTADLLKERRAKAFEKTHSLTDNFSSVYLLPQKILEKLLTEKITENDLSWLAKLPKTDLHCHLGGFGDAKFLKKAAQFILEDYKTDLQRLKNQIENFFSCRTEEIDFQKFRQKFPAKNHCLENLQKFYSNLNFHEKSFVTNAAFLELLTENQIRNLMFEDFEQDFKNKGLEVYTQIGNFGGSALLQTEKVLRFALDELLMASFEQNVRYLEVRCSPENYTKGGLSGTQVLEILLDEAEKFTGLHKNFSVNFLVMGTRHKDEKLIEKHVDLTQKYFNPSSTKPTVCGFDLAGKESGNPPGKFGEIFLPLHRKFVNITTHAGEMTSEKDIWEAIFVLHAKRIGHGLKLYQNPEMIKFLRDYKLVLEMCPSSNFQTNDFSNGEKYPLKSYLEQGIKVTVNTDNYGISQTNITREFLKASLMTEGGLSKWEILRILKNGFKAAFLPLDRKNKLLREIDTEIFELLLKDYV